MAQCEHLSSPNGCSSRDVNEAQYFEINKCPRSPPGCLPLTTWSQKSPNLRATRDNPCCDGQNANPTQG